MSNPTKDTLWICKGAWYSPTSGKLSYAIIHRIVGRIYGLDLGADHRNPVGEVVGEKSQELLGTRQS